MRYCAWFESENDFKFPHVDWDNGTRYITDAQKCPYNESESSFQLPEFDNKACYDASAQSPFVDPNLGSDFRRCTGYKNSSSPDIGDGECDDACRIPECQFDGGDCERGCVDDACSQKLMAWNLFVPSGVYKMNHTDVCADVWPVVLAFFTPTGQFTNCEWVVNEYDFNNDKAINFREFTAIAYSFVGSGQEKAKQLNCSSCVGMEYYNI